MLIPTNLIKAMVKVISPKNFSPALTYLYYSKDDNAFIGTDSFTLLKFYPVGPALQKDMYINFNEMKAIKCMGTKDDAIDFTEQPDGTIGINGIESECVFFMKPIDDILAKYPDTNQPSLFGSVKGELQRLPYILGVSILLITPLWNKILTLYYDYLGISSDMRFVFGMVTVIIRVGFAIYTGYLLVKEMGRKLD